MAQWKKKKAQLEIVWQWYELISFWSFLLLSGSFVSQCQNTRWLSLRVLLVEENTNAGVGKPPVGLQ